MRAHDPLHYPVMRPILRAAIRPIYRTQGQLWSNGGKARDMLIKCIRDITRVTAMCPAAPRQTLPSVQLSSRKRSQTHDRLLDFAYDANIQKGLDGTPNEERIAAVGITQSGL